MPDYLTSEQARRWDCPIARIHPHPEQTKGKCQGPGCMFWRWRPLMANKEWATAFEAAATEYKREINVDPARKDKMNLADAKAHVRDNLADFDLKGDLIEGWCGMAGEPKA